ncbi:MAG TPA: DUF6701 domain-containing protein, partial [Pseudomonas sp.]|nr:DUF6701 domain-containing protein [Pseudomonas sp.]
NFSNPTETRNGGPGLRADSVSIRGSGSGTTGYPYLAGTAAGLSPGIDVAGTTAGPGHTYRITLDSTISGKTLVTVERNTGTAFTTLIPTFDARAKSGQAGLPNDFFMSLTGSTGGSNNIHELDDFQICASRMNTVGQQIDHFDLVYATAAPLTCNPLPVTVRACQNAACTQLYTGPMTVTLSPPGWVGGDTHTFSGGQATFNLQVRSAGTVTLGVPSSTPSARPQSLTTCSTSGCKVTFVDSGFIFSIPTQLAGKESAEIQMQALRTNPQTQKCEPSFKSVTRQVSFWSDYVNPNPTEILGAPQITLRYNDSSSSSLIPTVASTPKELPIQFDANAAAKLWVRYPDAGKLTLNAYHFSDQAYAAGSASFVVKPYGLLLQTDTDAKCTVADINCPLFPGGVRAGDTFKLKVKAVAWQSDNEPLTASALVDNAVTPNFRQTDITLSSSIQAPASGDNGVMSPTSYEHVLGSQTAADTSISEVGVFRITATPPPKGYLDNETVSGGTSALVGRFIPASLDVVGSASLTPSCGNAFSYQGQPMYFSTIPNLKITGKNRQNAITKNYDIDPFWRLPVPTRTDAAADADDDYSSVTGKPSLDAAGRLLRSGAMDTTTNEAGDKDGARLYSWRGSQQGDGSYKGESLIYSPPPLPIADDYPFDAAIKLDFLASSLKDIDGACYGGTSCSGYSLAFAGSKVRLGRLRIGNAHGSELQSLSLPLVLESWQSKAGGSFQIEDLDTCTVLGAATLDNFTGHLALGETTSSLTAPVAGIGSLQLSAPGSGNDGSVQVSFPLAPTWLQYPWDGVTRSAARGLASFGIYKGAAPLIYRRELYR